MASSPYAHLPQIDRLLRSAEGRSLLARYARSPVVDALRAALDEARARIADGAEPPADDAHYLSRAGELLARSGRPSLRRVINATGIILHTNLGRSALAPAALQAVQEAASGYSSLEIDLDTGERGSRIGHVEGLLRRLTGAEAAAVYNNNAAAVLLALTALAAGRPVIVSRGQLVEIGGSFRIPDIIQAGGARLIEVGTTNRTRLDDYRRAVTPDTALLLKVHPSNYRIVGFEESVPSADLAAFGRECGIPVMEDLGSGALVDAAACGIGEEPTVQASVRAGLDLVAFSGDKMLGGPQAGILVGRAGLIEAIRRHSLARALRCDKMTLAALEATLRLYSEERAWEEIPTLRYLARTPDEIGALAGAMRSRIAPPLSAELVAGFSQVGGGALPGEQIPTTLLSLCADGVSDADLAARLRGGDPPVLARMRGGRVLLDLRTVEADDIDILVSALESIRQTGYG